MTTEHALITAARGPHRCASVLAGVASVLAPLIAFLLILARPAMSAAVAGGGTEKTEAQLSLPEGIGWDDWQAVREQHNGRAMVRVFVPKGEAPPTAKVRVVLALRPKPSIDSPQAILDTIVQTAKHQCQKISAKVLDKSAGELLFELRGVGCAGQSGERYLLQRIAFSGQWEIEATYAPMVSTDDLPALQKEHAIKLLSSVSVSTGASPAADSGWFLITPPRKADGHYDDSATLSKWKVEEGAGSEDKCERLRTALNSLALKQGSASDIEQVKASRCISMNDPRLEE